MQQFIYGKSTYGDHPVDEYTSSLSGTEQTIIRHIYDIAKELVPDAEQGISYGMPCLKYKDKGLVSVMVTKRFLSLYPFSAVDRVISKEKLAGFETTSGSIHFSPAQPLPDDLVRAIIAARAAALAG